MAPNWATLLGTWHESRTGLHDAELAEMLPEQEDYSSQGGVQNKANRNKARKKGRGGKESQTSKWGRLLAAEVQ